MRHFLTSSAVFLVAACSSNHSDEQQRVLDVLHQDPRCREAASVDIREPHVRLVGSAGVVSSERIAQDIAYAYLRAIYPDDQHLRPMTASLTKGVWTVNGTLPKGRLGGVAAIALCQSNGRVLEIAHGK
jgi:NTF2 fold immunity protein